LKLSEGVKIFALTRVASLLAFEKKGQRPIDDKQNVGFHTIMLCLSARADLCAELLNADGQKAYIFSRIKTI
jgi:hypothetical protein